MKKSQQLQYLCSTQHPLIGLPMTRIKDAFDEMLQAFTSLTSEKGTCTIRGFGSFYVRNVGGRDTIRFKASEFNKEGLSAPTAVTKRLRENLGLTNKQAKAMVYGFACLVNHQVSTEKKCQFRGWGAFFDVRLAERSYVTTSKTKQQRRTTVPARNVTRFKLSDAQRDLLL